MAVGRAASEVASGVVERQRERSRAEVAAEHALRLQDVTQGLAAAATSAEIADVIFTLGMPALDARTCILGVLDSPDELRFVRTFGYGGVFPDRLKLDEPWPITTAVRTRSLIELRDLSQRRAAYDVPERIWQASAPGTLVAVPLVAADGAAIGALGFTREHPATLTQDERRLIETLARLAAQALERAWLYEADRQARIQAEGLQRVTSAVATAATVKDVAEAVASEALSVVGASGVTIVVTRQDDDETADVLASKGTVADYAETEPRLNLHNATVTASALRSGTAVYAESMEELERCWPASARVAREVGVSAIACVPLRAGRRRGALSVVVDRPRRFTPDDRRFLDLLAYTCEQGFIRAALYEAEREARTRSDVLQGLAAKLSGSLSVSDVGRAFLDHALGHLGAASGALLLFDPADDLLKAVAVEGTGPTRPRWMSSVSPNAEYVVTSAYREGKPVAATTRAEFEQRFPASAANFGPAAQAAHAWPILVGNRSIGAFGLEFEHERALSTEDERLLRTMADLCAQAIERAQLYESEHRIALRLQRALLPDAVAEHPAVEIAVRYESAGDAMEIGGDWYDSIALPDGRIGVAVGDVVGKGIEAAAAMGRLRSAFAAYALELSSPAEAMARLNDFATVHGGVDFATACYAIVDPVGGTVCYSSAGHPPMLLVDRSGGTRWLDEGCSQPLHGGAGFDAAEAIVPLEPAALLLLYSDGLVERRRENIDVGLGRLEAAAKALRDRPVEEICDELISQLRVVGDQEDDIVLLAVRAAPVDERVVQRIAPTRPDVARPTRSPRYDVAHSKRSHPP